MSPPPTRAIVAMEISRSAPGCRRRGRACRLAVVPERGSTRGRLFLCSQLVFVELNGSDSFTAALMDFFFWFFFPVPVFVSSPDPSSAPRPPLASLHSGWELKKKRFLLRTTRIVRRRRGRSFTLAKNRGVRLSFAIISCGGANTANVLKH